MTETETETDRIADLRKQWGKLAGQNDAELLRNPLAWAFCHAGLQMLGLAEGIVTDLENQVERLTP